MLPQDIRHCANAIVKLLLQKDTAAGLKPCGAAVLDLLGRISKALEELGNGNGTPTHDTVTLALQLTDALVDQANDKINAYPYKDVPDHWRQLLIDGTLTRVVWLMHQQNPLYTDDFYRSLIHQLDTALVVSGAPGPNRRSLTLALVDAIQLALRPMKTDWPASVGDALSLIKADAAPTIHHPLTLLNVAPDFLWFEDHVNELPVPTPLHLRCGLIDHWPALSTRPWANLAYLRNVAGDRLVPVEIGSSYTHAAWRQTMMPLDDFITNHIQNSDDTPIAYLAQHDLFYQVPRLEQDIAVPDYCSVEPQATPWYQQPPVDVLKHAWFGPKHTVSPLHHDPYHNLLAQVVGRKYVRLYSPDHTDALYPHVGMMANTSQVDLDQPNLEAYPLFKQANYVECILEPGDVLYIPPKWWHYVRALDTSFSVSFWF
ncbi:Clavaminate synthase-like protein [Hesseltinella vesiculosa]|uniref:Clavaminate synthase-like protein n=1 Tax=Hesseltinella vesiculosa TaxID=101127 RepID=A0A1X2G4M8_9FUNG|nr:Clavaminate synthase-like protein [Hesseltinella vesiculosa]